MKKLLCLLAACVFFLSCSSKEQVAETRVDEELFEGRAVSVDELPFSVNLPGGWSVREESQLYTLSFDEGASGYIQIVKEPLETGELGCHEGAPKKYCTVESAGIFYSVVLTDKSMSPERRAEAEEILGNIH